MPLAHRCLHRFFRPFDLDYRTATVAGTVDRLVHDQTAYPYPARRTEFLASRLIAAVHLLLKHSLFFAPARH